MSIFLYMSLQSLQIDSMWYGVIPQIASKNFLWLVCIDKAHTVHQNGLFRPEFKSVIDTLCLIHGLLTVKCSIIAMLTTFRKVDQDVITNLLGRLPSMIMWLELSCQQIRIDAVCSGNPSASITLAMKQDAPFSQSKKQSYIQTPK
jgi:superfamily II DNA helicase RecQ